MNPGAEYGWLGTETSFSWFKQPSDIEYPKLKLSIPEQQMTEVPVVPELIPIISPIFNPYPLTPWFREEDSWLIARFAVYREIAA